VLQLVFFDSADFHRGFGFGIRRPTDSILDELHSELVLVDPCVLRAFADWVRSLSTDKMNAYQRHCTKNGASRGDRWRCESSILERGRQQSCGRG